MASQPVDGHHHRLDAAGVGGNVVERIDEGDGAEGAVNQVVHWYRQAIGLGELVEEAVAYLCIHFHLVHRRADGFAQMGCVHEVFDMDDGAFGDVDIHVLGCICAMCSTDDGDFILDAEGGQVAIHVLSRWP